jgi:hypothetical protein
MRHKPTFFLCLALTLLNSCHDSVEPENETISGYENNHAYVDLDLPSGLCWALCNVGAENNLQCGNYYAWAETQPKTNYNWQSYKYGLSNELTKYCTISSHSKNDFIDTLTILELSDDVAHTTWGGRWRMPSFDEWEELRTHCTWTWVEHFQNSTLNGYEILGTNGNSIFLPAAGCYFDSVLFYLGEYGGYWSNTLVESAPECAIGIQFGKSSINRRSGSRCVGPSARAVFKK